MPRKRKPVELGHVTDRNGTRHAVFDDMSWRVTARNGRDMPATAEGWEIVYDHFSDFPAPPGGQRLHDLAKMLGGKMHWRGVYKTAPGTVV